ncbi:cupin-like domain-containing protein [Glacieibacterium sp.]|uniref:cupin-like domain-containing protein n=1 Tax=Glacieibacterium sp. TaxID=2860237 RepID=UPI003B003F7E
MVAIARRTRIIDAAEFAPGDVEPLLASSQPTIVKGLAADWPLVQRGQQSPETAIDYLAGFDRGAPIVGYTGEPDSGGRYTYNADLTGFNFVRERVGLTDYLGRMRAQLGGVDTQSLYVGSTDLATYLPGFAQANPLPFTSKTLDACRPMASIWIGSRTIAPAHWDMSNNIAVCAVGRRRFTLFPPEQAANLYPGPLEPTPGGQVVSMVDFDAPDFERHPGFRDALAAAEVADLEPGDVLVYPALWWHQVEALDAFNVLVNYWWNTAEAFTDNPITTLLHGMLALRDRPDAEKQAWRVLFDYYVFGPADRAAAHLPPHARGPLEKLDERGARRLRAQILQKISR